MKKEGKKRPYRSRKVALNNLKGRSIEERPSQVNDRTENGHWEMDCVESGRGAKACPAGDDGTREPRGTVLRKNWKTPSAYRKPNGPHYIMRIPIVPGERGSNENANRLIRRFIPKSVDIGKYSERDIRRIERWMNNYPRKLLGYKTPIQVTASLV